MNLKPSRITIGFALLGLVMALIYFGICALPVSAREGMGNSSEVLIFLCPFSVRGIGLDADTTMGTWVLFGIFLVLTNMLIYSVIGLFVSFIVRMIKHWLDPTVLRSE